MCIVAIKPAGQALLSEDILINCFTNNPDGAGFMTARNGEVEISKGYMTMVEYWAAIQNANLNLTDVVIYHCRIGTSGGLKKPEHTHPFPISNKPKDLRAKAIKCQKAIAHNGIISIDHKFKESDTICFTRKILANPEVSDNLHNEAIQALIAKYIDNSKLVILEADGKTIMIGGGWVKDAGIVYSNNGYKKMHYGHNWMFYSDTEYCPECFVKLKDLECEECGNTFMEIDGMLISEYDLEPTDKLCPDCETPLIIAFYDEYYCTQCAALYEGNDQLVSL